MTQYNIDFTFPLLFPPQLMDNGLAEWLSKLHLAQYHVAGEFVLEGFFRSLMVFRFRDGKVRARNLLLQWKDGERVPVRRS